MRASRSVIAMAAVLAATAGPTACTGGGDRGIPRHPRAANRVATDYAPALGVDLATMEYRSHSGLFVRDVVAGQGPRADSGDVVTVHYTGWLPTGRQFDSSRDAEPISIPLGYGRVIAGWDQGVVGMRVGGQRRLVIPPALGYGDGGIGPIPGNATLIFDLDLVAVENRVPERGAEGADSGATAASAGP